MNKSFSNERLGSFSFGFLTNQYWTDKPNQYQFNLNYGNVWKLLNYSIGVSQTNYVNNSTKSDESIYLSLSLPLDYKKSNIFVNSNYQHNTVQDQTNDNFGVNLSPMGRHFCKVFLPCRVVRDLAAINRFWLHGNAAGAPRAALTLPSIENQSYDQHSSGIGYRDRSLFRSTILMDSSAFSMNWPHRPIRARYCPCVRRCCKMRD